MTRTGRRARTGDAFSFPCWWLIGRGTFQSWEKREILEGVETSQIWLPGWGSCHPNRFGFRPIFGSVATPRTTGKLCLEGGFVLGKQCSSAEQINSWEWFPILAILRQPHRAAFALLRCISSLGSDFSIFVERLFAPASAQKQPLLNRHRWPNTPLEQNMSTGTIKQIASN